MCSLATAISTQIEVKEVYPSPAYSGDEPAWRKSYRSSRAVKRLLQSTFILFLPFIDLSRALFRLFKYPSTCYQAAPFHLLITGIIPTSLRCSILLDIPFHPYFLFLFSYLGLSLAHYSPLSQKRFLGRITLKHR